MNFLRKLLAFLASLIMPPVVAVPVPTTPPEAPVVPVEASKPSEPVMPPLSNSNHLYNIAKTLLGQHLTMDPSVPPDVGCAEAWSYVADSAGVKGIPRFGFPSTIGVNDFLRANPDFEAIQTPEPGAIIVAVTNGPIHGHVGYFAKYDLQFKGDWGIMSNNSDTGLFRELWCLKDWQAHYTKTLGLKTNMYRWK